MTEEQMEKLAEIIFQKLLTRQAEFDKQFIEQVKQSGANIEVDYNDEVFGLDEKLVLQMEIAKLNELLSQHEENEDYNEAAKVHDKLNKLIDKLEKL
jgi:protein-arginine kinase activator protein McsA